VTTTLPLAGSRRTTQAAALAVFYLSGFAALLYQVVWQRILVIFSGADVYSSTLVVAAFMGGLGVGHLAGGHVADRVSRGAALRLFVAAELAIGAFGFVSRALYYDLLYQRIGSLDVAAPVLTGVLFASLLWPTFFMGVSLPLLARAVTDRLDRAAFTVGALYAVNTLGAATGALAATWAILPAVGMDVSLRIAAGLNLVCAALALPLVRRLRAAEGAPSPVPATAEAAAGGTAAGFATWAALYALAGFVALGLEIAWFRLLGVMMKSTAFTFGTLLAIYLTGVGGGAFAASLFAARLKRPALVFLLLQAAVGLTAGSVLAIFLAGATGMDELRRYFAAYDPLSVREAVAQLRGWSGGAPNLARDFVLLYFVVPVALILPPTLLMGASFPVLQRVVQTDLARLGRRVGLLQVSNIAGSVLGTVAVGWLALDAIGTAATIKALAALSSLFLVPAAIWGRGRRIALTAGAGGALAVALVFGVAPDARALWMRLHGIAGNRMIAGEDATGLSVLRLEAGGGRSAVTVFVNGVGQSTMPYGGVHTALGMLPAFLHRDPREAAIIGLGSGDTVYGVAGRPELTRIVAIEIIRPQLQGLHALRARYRDGGLDALLDDPRIEHRVGDGRLYLARADRRFDIIEADALRPTSAYSGNLYSVEYFELVRSRLKPGGLAATWAPTARVHDAFVRVFPHVVSVPGILVGSDEPIPIDLAAIRQRIAAPRAAEHYRRAGIDAARMIEEYFANPAVYAPGFDRTRLTDVNRDLFPKDEYDLSLPR
jgi:spermidine synthase